MIRKFTIFDGVATVGVLSYSAAELLTDRRARESAAKERLLQHLVGSHASVSHTPEGAPVLEGAEGYISLSHCATCAAMVISSRGPVGIDVETRRERQLRAVASRYLSPAELLAYTTPALMQRAWAAKEALYKAALRAGLPLCDGITLPLDAEGTDAVADGRPFQLYFEELPDYTILSVAIPATT